MSEYVEIDAQELNDYISNLEDENEALKAQVDVLRVAATVVLNSRDDDGITTSGLLAKFDELSKALSFLPTQCLAEIKAQAVEDVINSCCSMEYHSDVAMATASRMQLFANQLRQQAAKE